MVSLCLTSKQLHRLVVRRLYRTVHLHLGGTKDTNIAALLNPSNIGVQHIKHIDLYHDYSRDHNDEEENAIENLSRHTVFAVRMMLEFLPKDQLEKFRWHPWSKFSAENLVLLYRKQKKLKWHEAFTVDKPFDEKLKRELNFDSALGQVKDLGLWLDSKDSLHFAHELVKRVTKVNKITLRSSFDEEVLDGNELQDTSTEPGLISKTIFSHLMPFSECKTPIVVSELMLSEISLRYTRDTYSNIFSLPTLRNLRIHGCRGADAFFADLSRSNTIPHKLQTLELRHAHDTADAETLLSVTNFLCLVSGIEYLTIDITSTRALPDTKCFVRHAKTLKLLNVHTCSASSSTSDDEHVYEVADIEKITQKCTKLEQLSLAFPKRDITKATPTKYNNFTSHILRLPNLITLNITTWPTDISISHRMPRDEYEAILARKAATYFRIAGGRGHRGDPKGINTFPVSSSSNNTTTIPAANASLTTPGTGTAAPTTTPASTTPTATTATSPTTTTTPTPADPTPSDPTDPENPSPLTPHYIRHPPHLLRSRLALVAWGTTDSPHDRRDSQTTMIFAKGIYAHPGSPDCRRGPTAVMVDVCLRRYIEPRSDVLDFPLAHHGPPPCVDEEDDGGAADEESDDDV
ncbi:MAG: hypothetical protein M1828_004402 [Chrysothrix sp. TS-e1954]|nr:MAG: hypothetical protein M1828_004402 [Chrysothrix sp. TS-e1954]